MADKFCSECGAKLKKSDKFCSSCGTNIKEKKVTSDEKLAKKENKKDISNIRTAITKKPVIIGLAIIIVAILIILIYGAALNPISSIDISDISVEKDGKLYQINYSYSCSDDRIDDEVHIAVYKNGELLVAGDGTNDEFGVNSYYIKLDKDVEIDEIRFTVYDKSNHHKCIYNEVEGNFSIVKVKNMHDPFSDTNEKIPDEIDKDIDKFEIAKSHRDLYDYDGDGILNDYEFEQFCKGEGQEELLGY